MNPFMNSTVARPMGRIRSRWPRAIGAAGMAAAMAWGGPALAVDLNTASLEQLRSVRGIGPKTARLIVEERDRAGGFKSFDDLSDRVRGIGPQRAMGLRQAGLSIGTPTAPGAKAAVTGGTPAKRAGVAGAAR